jgi:hypothetical protein
MVVGFHMLKMILFDFGLVLARKMGRGQKSSIPYYSLVHG